MRSGEQRTIASEDLQHEGAQFRVDRLGNCPSRAHERLSKASALSGRRMTREALTLGLRLCGRGELSTQRGRSPEAQSSQLVLEPLAMATVAFAM